MSRFLGTGYEYPFKFKNGVLETAEGEESVRAAVWFLFSTRIGERFMLPEFGTRLFSILFEGIRPEVLRLAEVYAREEILRWIPRIEHVETQAEITGEHQVQLKLICWLINKPTPYTMVYPFYLQPK